MKFYLGLILMIALSGCATPSQRPIEAERTPTAERCAPMPKANFKSNRLAGIGDQVIVLQPALDVDGVSYSLSNSQHQPRNVVASELKAMCSIFGIGVVKRATATYKNDDRATAMIDADGSFMGLSTNFHAVDTLSCFTK